MGEYICKECGATFDTPMNMKNVMDLLTAHLRNGVCAHIVAKQDTKKRRVVIIVELRLQNPMLIPSMCMVVC